MKKKHLFIILILTLLSCNNKESNRKNETQNTDNLKNIDHKSNKFLDFLNHYEKDSLETILADNFYFISLNTNSDTIDKQTFLGEQLNRTKLFNGKYHILKILSKSEPKIFLVEDQSDYLKFLNIDSPIWKITIKKDNDSKIKQVIQDTTGNFIKYCSDILSKEELFNIWIKKKYPKETLMKLHENDSLLIERMKEYARNASH